MKPAYAFMRAALYRYRMEDYLELYYRLVETGILEGDRWVSRVGAHLIPATGPIVHRHRRILERLAEALSGHDPRLRMRPGHCLPIWPPDARQPDLALYDPRIWHCPGVALAVEVTGRTSSPELGFNAGLHRRAGVNGHSCISWACSAKLSATPWKPMTLELEHRLSALVDTPKMAVPQRVQLKRTKG
jgi:hypothetical protein